MSMKDRHLWGAGAAACAVCCALPLMTLLGIGVAGTAATVATFAFAGLTFAIVVGLGTLAAVWTQRRRRRVDSPGTPGPVDLELTPGRSGEDR
jgi:membrane protein implicated in regulation of membrane protease activity